MRLPMYLDNPFFVRETRQHARRPLPIQAGLIILVGVLSLALLVPLHLWLRYRGSDLPPTGFLAFLIVPHTIGCVVAGFYGADRIFADEHRRATLEALRFLPLSPVRWVLQRLAWPMHLVLLAWCCGWPLYVMAALYRIGTFDLNFLLSLVPVAFGAFTIPLVLLLPPDFRERMRAARLAGTNRRVKMDADLSLCWMVTLGLWFLCQYSLISGLMRRLATVPFYAGSIYLPGIWTATILSVLAAAATVAVSTISEREHWKTWAIRARVGAVGLLYYSLLGLVLGLMWSRLPFWAQWGPIALFPLLVWLLTRGQKKQKEDPWSARELDWAFSRWENPLFERDLRSFTRFASIRRWLAGEVLTLVGIYAGLVYLFVVKANADLGQFTIGALTMGAMMGALILVADASGRPFAMWMRERTSGTLPLLFMVPRTSREILSGRLQSAVLYALGAHVPFLLLTIAGLVWHATNTSWIIGAAVLLFSPLGLLFVVVLGCTVQPQTGPPWHWPLDDWLEVGLALAQVGLLVADVMFMVSLAMNPSPVGFMVLAVLTLANLAIVYGSYLVRIRQLEALRLGERALTER